MIREELLKEKLLYFDIDLQLYGGVDPVMHLYDIYFIGVIDNSGIRMRLTSQLRQHDIGSLVVGHDVSAYHVIPPRQPQFVTKGFCSENCINKVSSYTWNKKVLIITKKCKHAKLESSTLNCFT